jgi:hypothetical protein
MTTTNFIPATYNDNQALWCNKGISTMTTKQHTKRTNVVHHHKHHQRICWCITHPLELATYASSAPTSLPAEAMTVVSSLGANLAAGPSFAQRSRARRTVASLIAAIASGPLQCNHMGSAVNEHCTFCITQMGASCRSGCNLGDNVHDRV